MSKFFSKHAYFWVALCVCFLILLGWGRYSSHKTRETPDRDVLIQAAINSSYKGVYGNLHDLKKDYPGFTPNIRKWSAGIFFEPDLYATSMPEEEVITDIHGNFRTFRKCGSDESACVVVPPKDAQLSVIGIVHSGTYHEGFSPTTEFNVRWEGDFGFVETTGNCFVAHKRSDKRLRFFVEAPDHNVLEDKSKYGYWLYSFKLLDDERVSKGRRGFWTGPSSTRVSKELFDLLKGCDQQTIDNWPMRLPLHTVLLYNSERE